MEKQESTFLVDLAQFDIINQMIDEFKKEFNKKEIPIRRIKWNQGVSMDAPFIFLPFFKNFLTQIFIDEKPTS